MKCFTHLIKTISVTPELQITTNLISHQHELRIVEYSPLERKQQMCGMKTKEWVYLICETMNWQTLKKKYYDFATTNIVPNIWTNI